MLGVHVDVHGEWVMLWVAACNVYLLYILSMTDVVCLACMQKLLSPCMSNAAWVCMVCMVCVVYSLYGRLEFVML